VDEAVNDDVAQSSGGVVQVTFHDDVFTGLCKGTARDHLDNLVGFASSSVPTDPRSPRSIVPFPLVRVSITVLHSYIW